jgi:4-amino-4-deoxy-L-arabinose transferase-like glycosyltransferase
MLDLTPSGTGVAVLRLPRRIFYIVLAVVALLLLVRSGAPLFDPDEARFARTSVEMIRTGDIVVPQFEGQPRIVKPPMVHWVQSSFFRLFGVGERVARLHAILATLGSLLLVGWAARERFGDEAAVWAAAILGTMPLVLIVGRLGTIDALLAVHVFAAVAFDFATGSRTGERATPFGAYAIGGITGLAFLVKGPVGVIVPLLAMLAGRTAARRDVLPSWHNLMRGLAAWCVVVLPWALAFGQRLAFGRAFETVRTEVIDRYVTGFDHVEPPWFYVQVVLVGMLPWCAPLAVGLVRLVRRWRDPGARNGLYAAAALITGIAFFSIGKSKLPTYILPLAPLAALVVTWELGKELEENEPRPWGALLLAVTMGLLALGFGYGAVVLDPGPRGSAIAGALAFAAGAGVAAWALLARRDVRVTWGAAVIATSLFVGTTAFLLIPHLSERRSSAQLVEAVPALAGPRPIAVVDMKVPSLTFYLDKVPEEVPMSQLETRLATDAADLLLVFDVSDLPAAPAAAIDTLREVGRRGKYAVFESRE